MTAKDTETCCVHHRDAFTVTTSERESEKQLPVHSEVLKNPAGEKKKPAINE